MTKEAEQFVFPELFRSAGAFGALDEPPLVQTVHDMWFAPVLVPRRTLVGVTDPRRQITRFDAAAISRALLAACSAIAAQVAPGDPAAQRAIEATLEDEAEPVLAALDQVALAAEWVRGATEETLLSDWCAWTEAVRAAADALDDAWREVRAIVR